jgi:hypothetical protein
MDKQTHYSFRRYQRDAPSKLFSCVRMTSAVAIQLLHCRLMKCGSSHRGRIQQLHGYWSPLSYCHPNDQKDRETLKTQAKWTAYLLSQLQHPDRPRYL